MVSTSKILTVSYGTFSCTLEGFDDPFSTMRSIAEYFRDLAAQDRYFGAEPPTPDAEMLHQIAERELRRPVEARIENNNVVLRQAETPEPAGEPAAVAGETLLAETPGTPQPAMGEPRPAGTSDAAPQEADGRETGNQTADATGQPAKRKKATKARKAEKAARQKAKKARKEAKAKKRAAQQKARAAAPEAAAAAKAASQPAQTPAPAGAPAQAEPEQVKEAAASLSDVSIAAKLQRLRAVVSRESPDTDDTDLSYVEDFYAEMAGESQDGTDTVPENHLAPAEPIQFADEDADLTDDAANSPQPVKTKALDATAPIARVVKVRRKTAEPQHADQEDKATHGETTGQTADAARGWDAVEPSSLSPEDEAALMAELAQVEAETQAEQGRAPDITAPEVAAESAPSDMQAQEPDRTDVSGEETSPPARTAFDDSEIEGATAIERILAETDAKLQSEEATQKRASIAHLRAAVQAKRAEAEGDGADSAFDPLLLTDGRVDPAGEYRDDLEQAVQNRHRNRRRAAMAPLVLVSEQRIDEKPADQERANTPEPVRPRRVRLKRGAGNEDERLAAKRRRQLNIVREFTEFATSVGAQGAEELLEAAAAYRIHVVGQETFSRPQVMGLVLKSEIDGEITREAGLRAFGSLIRNGAIRKIERGRYTVSDRNRFKPNKARASA
ncbi:MAG TPA: hypothetical protein ENK45_02065 [Aliiroseovarius sp.]|nr:hypothetical protein [Aliiroseovarius sp.]